MTFIGDANDTTTILADANTFFMSSGYFADSDADEIGGITSEFTNDFIGQVLPPYWELGQKIAALIQVYDLVLPLELGQVQASTYLSRLGAIAGALLTNRDDKRGFPEDPFREVVMAAWGGFTTNRDGKWNTDVVTSGLFVYAMAAFARRVLDRPDLYPKLIPQAIVLINAVIETYEAFRPELNLGDSIAFYVLPLGYRDLTCNNGAKDCSYYRDNAGSPIAYNENLSMMQALAELALAANSNIYRASADATQLRLAVATKEAPLVIVRNLFWRTAQLRPKTFADLTPYYEWDYSQGAATSKM